MKLFLSEKSSKEVYYRWIGILGLGLILPLIFDPFREIDSYFTSVIYATIESALFWNGTMYTVLFSHKIFPFTKQIKLSIIMMFVFVTIFVLILFYFSFLFFTQIEKSVRTPSDIINNLLISLLITYFITTFYAASYFFTQWRYHLVKSEKLQRANLEARFETLKTQINPHFLFNSLNTLMYLVVDNPKAAAYIENLSDFMRYLLQTRDKEAVTLAEEIALVKKYIFIQQNRFGDKMQIDIDIPENYSQLAIPPLALQMLIENAIKHNVISSDNQLHIRIYTSNNHIIVENNLKEKIDKEPSTGVGLTNIKNRYQFLSGKEIVILVENNKFIVKLPLTEEIK
jgi:sensor histidine kinase YesM